MARVNNLTNFLTDVASAIKTKKGSNTVIPAANFDTEILALPSQGVYQTKETNITTNGNYEITPDTNYDAMDKLRLNVNVPTPQLQTKSYTFTQNTTTTLTPETSYDGFSSVDISINVPSSGSGDVKLFETIADMQADADPQEGDLAVVYGEGLIPPSPGDTLNSLNFPDRVTFDTPITTSSSLVLSAGFIPLTRINCDLTSTGFSAFSTRTTPTINVHYTTSDGLTYIKDRGESSYTLTQSVTIPTTADVNILKFLSITSKFFEGLYQYNTNSYVIADSQLDAISSDVYEKTFYGQNGPSVGTLGATVNNSFDDTAAAVMSKIQKQYDNLTPRVLTDSDKTVSTDIYLIPTKTDGTPLWDTSAVTDMNGMFQNRKNLFMIALLDTSNVTSMQNMFRSCTSLTTIPLLDTSSVADMRYTFSDCSSLVSIPLLDTSNVTYMASMFRNCASLATVPLLNTSNVTNMNAMFINCTNLTTIPLLDTHLVTDMYQMFYKCSNLTTIPQLDTRSVTTMGSMFMYCSNLTTIPQFDMSSVTDIDHMCDKCTALTSVPQLNTSRVTTMYYAFNECSSLTTVPVLNTSLTSNMTYMFHDCPLLSNESLNNILQMCINATSYTNTKTLKIVGLTQAQATTCQSLSNYSAFIAAGWTTGY